MEFGEVEQGVGGETGAGGPAAVDGGAVNSRAGGDRAGRERPIAAFPEQLPDHLEDRPTHIGASPAGAAAHCIEGWARSLEGHEEQSYLTNTTLDAILLTQQLMR
jgi:hypothetical protein